MRKMQNEFNTQRAKMRELYMQKEAEVSQSQLERRQLQAELDELKTKCVVADLKSQNELQMKDIKAQEEISSLQQLVQDTIEESAHYKGELEHLKLELAKYQQTHTQENEYIFVYILFSIRFLQLITLLSFYLNAGDDICII